MMVAIVIVAPAVGTTWSTAETHEGPGSTTSSTSTTTSTTSTTTDLAPTSTSTPSTTSSTTSSSTTSPPDDGGEPLPPASVEPLPPEETLPPVTPPLIPPAPPAGADEAGRRRALIELKATEAALRKAKAAEALLRKRLVPFADRLAAATAVMAALDDEERRLTTELSDARVKVKKMAVAGYVHGGNTQPVNFILRAKDPLDLARRRTIIRTATEARSSAVIKFSNARRQTSDHLEAAVAVFEEARVAFAGFEAEVNSAAYIRGLVEAEVAEKRQLLDHATAATTVGTTDIPRLFFDAYRKAAATLAKRAPHCRVGWTAIAAIGRIEANHGRYRGAQFALNGDVYPRILGIPLDGTRSALIRDTDQGLLDSDLEFDRAVGPMQFIPSTWARINEDGNNDRVSDPNNAYDAALGTAAYLCRAVPSGGLDLDENLRPAFFSYNHSDAYVEKVLEQAHLYAAA